MLHTKKLSAHLMILFLIMTGIALIMGGLSLGTVQRLHGRITDLYVEDIPLILAISEIAKEQLDQTLRINEIFLYGEIDDREKFEASNNGFVNAGKRLTNVLIEALHITQKGLENPASTTEKHHLSATKTVLGEYQKIHGSFEHLSGIIIRNQYKYRFLTRASIITGNEELALAEAESEHVKQLSKSISDLDDETKRIENKLKEAFHITKKMVQDLAPQATREKNFALIVFFLAMTILAVSGFFLTLSIGRVYQKKADKDQNNRRRLAASLKEKAAILKPSTEQLKELIDKVALNNNEEEDRVKSAEITLSTLTTLASDNAKTSSEAVLLSQENQQKTKDSDTSMQTFKESSTRSIALAHRIQKGLNGLVQAVMQVNLLATSACVEATRKDVSQGFVVFTNEIKDLAQSAVKTIETIAELVERDVREIKGGHDQVTSTRQTFTEMVEITTQLSKRAHQIEVTSKEQSALIQKLQEELVSTHHAVSHNSQLLHDGHKVCQTLHSHAILYLTALDPLADTFGDRRSQKEKEAPDTQAPEEETAKTEPSTDESTEKNR